MSDFSTLPHSSLKKKKKINTMYHPDPWQKFLSAFRPKNSSHSEQLLSFTHEHAGVAQAGVAQAGVAHAFPLLGNPECSLQPTASVAIFTRSDVVPALASFTPTLKIHLKCYLL